MLGPVLVNYIREYQIDHGVARADAYTVTMYILSGLLLLGCLCNALVTPVSTKYHMSAEDIAAEKRLADDTHPHPSGDARALATAVGHSSRVAAAWLAVGLPLVWGMWITVEKAGALFR